MKLHDSLSGALLILFGTAVFLYTRTFPSMMGDPVGPALFPRIIAAGLVLTGAVLIALAARKSRADSWISFSEWLQVPRLAAGFAVVTGGLLAYCLLVETLGFFICAPLLLAALFAVLRVRAWLIAPLAIVVSVVIHFIFYKGLGVPLPWGVLQAWAW
jgi:putative tricarboxylic transport membrane protein